MLITRSNLVMDTTKMKLYNEREKPKHYSVMHIRVSANIRVRVVVFLYSFYSNTRRYLSLLTIRVTTISELIYCLTSIREYAMSELIYWLTYISVATIGPTAWIQQLVTSCDYP